MLREMAWRPLVLPRAALAGVAVWATAVLGDGDSYKPGLLIVPRGGSVEVGEFVRQHNEPRHAVAVGIVGRGTKRHKLLEELAEDKELMHLLAVAVQFQRGDTSLAMHRHRYPVETYAGKWTRSALRAWLQETAYPLVNRMQYQFAPAKYLSESAYGVVLVVKPITEQSNELVSALEPFAEKYRSRLKFTFFTKVKDSQKLCDQHGIWSNDELLLIEKPRERRSFKKHSHMPSSAKYRMQGVTPESVERFFGEYAAGAWPRYYTSSAPQAAPVVRHGIRELTGWDFVETVNDPRSSVLVEFASANCHACEEFSAAYQEVASRLQRAQRKDPRLFSHMLIGRIDQSENEHSELIKGTPWLRYWARGSRKRPVDVELRSVESIWEFLEERAADEVEADPGSSGDFGTEAGSAGEAAGAGGGHQRTAQGRRSDL